MVISTSFHWHSTQYQFPQPAMGNFLECQQIFHHRNCFSKTCIKCLKNEHQTAFLVNLCEAWGQKPWLTHFYIPCTWHSVWNCNRRSVVLIKWVNEWIDKFIWSGLSRFLKIKCKMISIRNRIPSSRNKPYKKVK